MFRQACASVVSLFLLGALPGQAQVLARPGWAGSGVAPEAWWPRAVFYRLDPARFQDSDGDGRGDLPGVLQRLDYLQALGVDAILLDGSFDPKDIDALGDLVREASRHQLRVLVTASPDAVQGSRGALLNLLRGWLGAGVAGVAVPKPGAAGAADGGYAALVASVREVMQSFPGERVLLTDPSPVALAAPRPVHFPRRIDPGAFQAARDGVLVTTTIFSVDHADIAQLRTGLSAVGENSSGSHGLARFAAPPSTGSPDAAGDAALLLGFGGAVVLDFGEELGLDLYPRPATEAAATTLLPIMQWTPSNQTQAPERATAPQAGQATGTQFGAYHPYVPPPRGLAGAPPARIQVAPDLNIPDALPDPDTLPGFTSIALPMGLKGNPKLNAITEDRDSQSLLNAYRQLIALHHGNATLRSGAPTVLNRDAEGALVWVRRAPAGSRTAANVVLAENRTAQPATVALNSNLEEAGMRAGALRPLFSSAPEATTGESTDRLFLPPHSVFVGEIYHSGAVAEPVAHGHRRGHRGHHHSRR